LTYIKKAWPFAVLAVVAAAVSAGLVLAWRAESRGAEDPAPAISELRAKEARIATATWGLIDMLDRLRNEELALRPGTQGYETNMEKQRDIQNLVAVEMPALVYRRDEQGNAVIVGVEMARTHLQVMIDAAADAERK